MRLLSWQFSKQNRMLAAQQRLFFFLSIESNIRTRNNCRVLLVADYLPRQLCSQHVIKKKLVSKAKAASEADQFKHWAKVVIHPEVLRVLNALPRHSAITVTALQRSLLVVGFYSCRLDWQESPEGCGVYNSSSREGRCPGPRVLSR